MKTLFHILIREEAAAIGPDVYAPSSLAAEGFIHCSYRDQVCSVADAVFAGREDLMLLELDAARIDAPIVEETASGTDERFPHVYGPIPREAIVRIHPLPHNNEGGFRLAASVAIEPQPPVPTSLLEAFEWYDHPEGPKFVETHRDEQRTCGHWLFRQGVFSGFHQVRNNEELWLIQQGRLLLYVIDLDGHLQTHTLGQDVAHGEVPVAAVPVNHWQAAELPAGEPYAFGSNVCSPAFEFDQFAMGDRKTLCEQFPRHAELIARLTYGGEG